MCGAEDGGAPVGESLFVRLRQVGRTKLECEAGSLSQPPPVRRTRCSVQMGLAQACADGVQERRRGARRGGVEQLLERLAHLPLGAIRRNQEQSCVIMRNHAQSGVIRRNQAQSGAIRRMQLHASRALDVIKGHQRVIVEFIRGLHGAIHTNQGSCSRPREWRRRMTPSPHVEGTRPHLRSTPPLVQA